MDVEITAAWVAAAAAIGSAGVSWFAQRGAARAAAAAETQTAIVTAKTDIWTSDKLIYVERVTAERAVWRSELRSATSSVVAFLTAPPTSGDGEHLLERTLADIALRLNPDGRSADPATRDHQPLDRDILDVISRIRDAATGGSDRRLLARELEEAVGPLLKQEWEVSKGEAKRATLT